MITANSFDTVEARESQDVERGGRGEAASGEWFNVGSTERWVSLGAGALLVLNGLRRPRLTNLALAGFGAMLVQRGVSGHCKLYEMLGVNTADGEGAAPEEYFERGIQVVEAFTINKPAEELYRFWHKFENLPRFMKHLESVKTVEGGKRSHWVAKGPMGMSVRWDAEVINDEPNQLIAWRSLGGADVDNAGSVSFKSAPADRGTEVTVTMDYIPPGGRAGSIIAKLFGRDADQMVREDLRNFKRLMEAGELPTIEGQPRGTCASNV